MTASNPNPAPGELRPCPMCGAEAMSPGSVRPGEFPDTYVECSRCSTFGPSAQEVTEALAAWNNRPAEDALRARIDDLEEQLAQEVSDSVEVSADTNEVIRKQDEDIDALRARVAELERLDLESERSCPRCNGKGFRMYASTAVWTGAAGGQALTRGVCDRCWGTGNEQEPGINGRELVAAKREVKRLRARVAELETEHERLRSALQSLDAELSEPDGEIYGADEELVGRWAEMVRAALDAGGAS